MTSNGLLVHIYRRCDKYSRGDRGGLTRISLNYVFRKTNISVLKPVGIPIGPIHCCMPSQYAT